VVIADTDALIAALHAGDANFARARATVAYLLQAQAQTLFPVSTIAETVTTLKRKLNEPTLAAEVIGAVTRGDLALADADAGLLHEATRAFDPAGSKQNTLFDALVAATARRARATIIFSFDQWYEKLGFTLAWRLVQQSSW
jgi:predicted nucleic acid-binding protein